jgi:hypothetical protein
MTAWLAFAFGGWLGVVAGFFVAVLLLAMPRDENTLDDRRGGVR